MLSAQLSANLTKLLGAGATPDEVAAELAKLDFYSRHKNPLVRIGEGGDDARPPRLALKLIEYVRSHDVDAALTALSDFVSIEQVTAMTYVYVENVTTDVVVDLGEDVMALPESAVPNPSFAEQIGRVKSDLIIQPGAILRAVQTYQPFVRCPKHEGPTPWSNLHLTPPGVDQIETALKMITLTGPAMPAIRARTVIVNEKALRLYAFNGSGTSFDYPAHSLTSWPVTITQQAKEWSALYSALDESSRRRVDIAINRLGLSVAKRHPSEAIVDLAIALEAILSDKGNKDELQYRLRVRGALFLEIEIDGRKRVKDLIRDIYKERSGIVHGEEPGRGDAALCTTARELVIRLIKCVLEKGFVPDWAVIELTGGTQIQQA